MAVVKLNQKGDISEGVSDTIQYFLDRLYINRSDLFCGNMPDYEADLFCGNMPDYEAKLLAGSQSTC